MLRQLGRIGTVFALCWAIGLHWIALQSVAWTTMIIKYSSRTTLTQAVAQTFDGSHPCSLCHAVKAGKASEKKSHDQTTRDRIDLIYQGRRPQLIPPVVPFGYAAVAVATIESRASPPVPPPRFTA